MIVAVDARNVYRAERRGTGKNLIDVYRQLAILRPQWRFVMLHEGDAAANPFSDYVNINEVALKIRGSRFNLWQDVALPLGAKRYGATVLHAPANTAPYFTATPLVVTVHDLIPLEMQPDAPATSTWLNRVRRGAHRARRVVTPSAWSKRQIVTHLDVPASKVVVNYWAPDRSCHKVQDSGAFEAIRHKYGIPVGDGFVVAFGGSDLRKNTRRIIEAWAQVPSAVRDRNLLVIVGNQEPEWSTLTELATTLGVAARCRLNGFADEADIAPLLSGASALCYPSLSEGFGLPLVDAFVCETPIVTSGTTSLGEIAADAALLVDPQNVNEIAAGLTSLLTDSAVVDRLRENARRRRATFSWERCAETLAEVLEAAAP